MFSKQEIRAAILDTANLFESNPRLYNFWKGTVPECDTPGCMLGYIGHFLGISGDAQEKVGPIVLTEYKHPLTKRPGANFYWHICGLAGLDYGRNVKTAINGLRAYADKYFPAEQLDPSYLKFRESLCEMAV